MAYAECNDAVSTVMPLRVSELEACLLVAGATATADTLCAALAISGEELEAALTDLQSHYEDGQRGVRVMRHGGRIQLTSAPGHAAVVARFLGAPERVKLSPVVMETLAIVAYRQPVTRPEIESVRGVNSDHAMRVLLDHGLIEERGHVDTPGRPAVYGTTMRFLEALGLTSLDDLPPIDVPPRDSA